MQAGKAKEPTLEHTWTDSAYAGRFVTLVADTLDVEVEVVRRATEGSGVWHKEGEPPPTAPQGFQVVPWRWIVERTLAWLTRNRRLSKDYEGLPQVSEAWLWVAATRLLVARLAEPVALAENM